MIISIFSLILPENIGSHDQTALIQTPGLQTEWESTSSCCTGEELPSSFENSYKLLVRRKPMVVWLWSCGTLVNQCFLSSKKKKKAFCSVCNSSGVNMPALADFKPPLVLLPSLYNSRIFNSWLISHSNPLQLTTGPAITEQVWKVC